MQKIYQRSQSFGKAGRTKSPFVFKIQYISSQQLTIAFPCSFVDMLTTKNPQTFKALWIWRRTPPGFNDQAVIYMSRGYPKPNMSLKKKRSIWKRKKSKPTLGEKKKAKFYSGALRPIEVGGGSPGPLPSPSRTSPLSTNRACLPATPCSTIFSQAIFSFQCDACDFFFWLVQQPPPLVVLAHTYIICQPNPLGTNGCQLYFPPQTGVNHKEV